jgi:protocatechuate 3,4-dioxygenase beta subunit
MQKTQAPSSPRWRLALGILTFAVVVCVALVLRRRVALPPARGAAATSAGAHGGRAAAPIDVSARPRAGISGHVVDPDAQPVARASVCVWGLPGTGLVTTQTRAPRCTETDTSGSFALDDLFPATPLAVSAAAKGFVPTGFRGPDGEGELRLGDGERRRGVDIVLRRGGVAIKGSVVDVTGGAVSGALVMSQDGVDRSIATSDPKGEFTLWVAPGRISVGATAQAYAPGWDSGMAPGHFFRIHLVPGATLVGRAVVAGSDTPVSGVMVEGIQVEGGWSRASTRTDDEGRFKIEGLVPGRYRIEATSEGREGYSRSSITLGLGETSSEVVVELDPAYVVRGRVVDKATGEPCKSGQVTITDHKQNEFSQAAIQPDGWARMASVIPGNYKVEVACKDHVGRDDYAAVTITNKDAPPLTWEVDRGASVRVDVVDQHGQKVEKASVAAFASGPDGVNGHADHADPDGTYVVAGLKPGAYNVTVHTNEGGRGQASVTVSADREERVRVELPAAGTIDGVVEDDAHRPVANVQVIASGAGHGTGRSLEDGTFSITGLSAGDYEVRAGDRWSRQRAPDVIDDAQVAKVTVTAPGHVHVTVKAAARNGTIEGHVTDGSGKPVTDAFIDSAPASSGVPRYGSAGGAPVVTDTEGHFTIESLADGTYNLRAYRKGGGETTVEQVKVGTRDVALKLGDGGSITGTLMAKGAPVERFTLDLRNTTTGFDRNELFFHAGGQFSISALPAGTYAVQAETPDGTARTEVTLGEGEQKAGVLLTLTMRGVVTGRLVELEGGAAIAGMRLNVDGSSPITLMTGDDRSNRSGPDGRFRLEGVLPGSWMLTVLPADPAFTFMSVPIVVQEGGGSTDVGAVRLPRARVTPGDAQGQLGVAVRSDNANAEVTFVYGPAAAAGIQVGDVVVSVDGFDVRGDNRYLFAPLTTVAPGRSVAFGLARGGSVNVVAGGGAGDDAFQLR